MCPSIPALGPLIGYDSLPDFGGAEPPLAHGTYTDRPMRDWEIGGTKIQDTLETMMVFRDE